jgi:hypothetical protein
MINVMVDLETLGVNGSPAIAAIGAVEFYPTSRSGGLGREFHQAVNLKSCTDIGMTIDAETVRWWMQQSNAARDIFRSGGLPIRDVLRAFDHWLPTRDDVVIWGNGASEDNMWLTSAYRLMGLTPPWSFRENRCFRTLRELNPDVQVEYTGTAHNALDDAKNQARHAIAILGKK